MKDTAPPLYNDDIPQEVATKVQDEHTLAEDTWEPRSTLSNRGSAYLSKMLWNLKTEIILSHVAVTTGLLQVVRLAVRHVL